MATGTDNEEIAKGLLIYLKASMLPINMKVICSAE
jgi:hypothetical protein